MGATCLRMVHVKKNSFLLKPLTEDTWNMAVPTIGVDVALEPHVATRYLTAGIVIMKLRTISMLTRNFDMRFLVTRWKGLFAHFVVLSKRFGKFASIAVCAWGDISVKRVSYLMMIYPRDSITAMVVEFAGLVGWRTSSTVPNADVVIQFC